MYTPVRTITLRKKYCPWITDNIKIIMGLRDQAYIRCRESGDPLDFQHYRDLRNFTNASIKREKRAYIEYKLSNKGIKDLWVGFRDLGIVRQKNKSIPESLADADEMNEHFLQTQIDSPGNIDLINYYNNNILERVQEKFTFSLVTVEQVENALLSIKSNAVGADGIGLRMVRLCCPDILPYLCHIINVCLELSVCPDEWKRGLIHPIPKGNNPTGVGDLRPITILPVMSKILERIVFEQLRVHLEAYNILPVNQSGFRSGHSCTTALLAVIDDVLRAVDDGEAVVLVLLDFSKAFDTVHRGTLLAILHYIGLTDAAVKFFESYLSNRTQLVSVNGRYSSERRVVSGVAQGSIIGPILYLIYTIDLCKKLKYCKSHMYADDTQLYMALNNDELRSVQYKINADLRRLVDYAETLCLNINATKSSVICFGGRAAVARIKSSLNIYINHTRLEFTDDARNLGMTIDSQLRFSKHVNLLVRRAFSTLKLLYNNRHLLNQKLKTQLCDTLILSVFNYGDVIYHPCLDAIHKSRIQRVQNACLRFIYEIRRYDAISHTLGWVGWLNMSRRRVLHTVCLFSKILQRESPPYLYLKIRFRTDVHNINVRHKNTLTIPQHRLEIFKRSFSYCVPDVLNGRGLLSGVRGVRV